MSPSDPTPFFSDRPTVASQPLTRIITIPPGDPFDTVILSPKYYGVFTHWWEKRTVPCTGRPNARGVIEGCHLDHKIAGTNWQAWLCVQSVKNRKAFFTAVTMSAFRDCPQLLAGQGHLRGMVARFWRYGVDKNSRLGLKIDPHLFSTWTIPDPVDTMVFLENLWGKNFWFVRKQDVPDEPTKPKKGRK